MTNENDPIRRVQHIRRGTTYRVLGRGQIQTDTDLRDYDEVVVYQCETDGKVWVRAAAEFNDPARFKPLAALPSDDRVAKLVEALRWYDDPSSQGDVARAALAAWKAGK